MKKSLNPESEKISFSDDVTIKDVALSEKIDNFMRARFDLEEVMNDPMYAQIHSETASLVADHRKKPENSKFIREAFSEALANAKLENEIKEIKSEASDNNIDGLTAEWVNEWHRKKQMQGAPSEADKERESFIKGIAAKVEEPSPSYTGTEKHVVRKRFIQYFALPAAAVLGGFIILRSLTISSSPEEMFSSYYTPFNSMSPVKRGSENQKDMLFSEAVKNYIAGNYTNASLAFSKIIAEDPASGKACFYLGLSEIASGNIENAIKSLSSGSVRDSEFNQEAQWYIAMAYLKKGDGKNAAACLKSLSASDGFYSERSRKILRRLK